MALMGRSIAAMKCPISVGYRNEMKPQVDEPQSWMDRSGGLRSFRNSSSKGVNWCDCIRAGSRVALLTGAIAFSLHSLKALNKHWTQRMIHDDSLLL
jgi:hypothetical protein